MVKTIRLILEYDGTDFVGWQRQANGTSIQETVEGALSRIAKEPVVLHSSGRTDAGVHARGMVAHFRTPMQLPLTAWREGANSLLPPSVAIREAAEVPEGFHARFSARGKWYRYSLCLCPVRSPLSSRFSWQIRSPLDVEEMRKGAADFVGRHDFAAFRSSGCNARRTEREISDVDVVKEDDFLFIDFRGSGFLRNMVRIMAGTLVEIGLGKRPSDDVGRLLRSGNREGAGRTAPPQGLCLMEVWY